MKLPRLITRRRVKWVGLVATIVVVAATVFSMFGIVAYWRNIGDDGSGRGVFLGPFDVEYVRRGPNAMSAQFGPDGFYFFAVDPSQWNIELMPFFSRNAQWTTFAIPLWLPLLLIAAPTAYLWHTDRRAKPWQCPKCRYDLRGLDGGVCPECGASVESC